MVQQCNTVFSCFKQKAFTLENNYCWITTHVALLIFQEYRHGNLVCGGSHWIHISTICGLAGMKCATDFYHINELYLRVMLSRRIKTFIGCQLYISDCRSHCFKSWGEGLAQWWAPLAFDQYGPGYVGWFCCWFSTLHRGVFLRALRVSPLQNFQIPIRPGCRTSLKTTSMSGASWVNIIIYAYSRSITAFHHRCKHEAFTFSLLVRFTYTQPQKWVLGKRKEEKENDIIGQLSCKKTCKENL